MNTLQQYRPSPFLGSMGGGRRLKPRWVPGLEFCPDMNIEVPDLHRGAPALIWADSGYDHRVIQVTGDSAFNIRYDASGMYVQNDASNGLSSISALSSPSVIFPTTGISISAWYKPDSFSDYTIIVGRGNFADEYGIGIGAAGQPFGMLDYDAGNYSNFGFGPTLKLGTWYHLLYTWDGTTAVYYVNGAITNIQTFSHSFGHANSAAWSVNVLASGTQGAGSVRYPMAWHDRVLTPQDAYDLYANPSPYQEGYLSQEVLNSVLVSVATPPVDATLPYIKPRHGGTGHGELPRSVTSSTFTCNYDDYLIEADTTTAGPITGYLPGIGARTNSRRFVVVNTGSHDVTMNVFGGGTIAGASTYTIPSGQSAVFVGGTSEWKVEASQFDSTSLSASLATKADKSTGLTATEGVQRTSGSDLSAAAQLKLDINALTADASPDSAADYVATWDASASQHKKVLLSNLPGGGGGGGGPTIGYGALGSRPSGSDGDLYFLSDIPNFGMSYVKSGGVWNALWRGQAVTPTPASDWTGTGGTMTKSDVAGVLTLTCPSGDGGNFFYKAVPSYPYTIIVRAIPILVTTNYSSFVCGWADNSNKQDYVAIQYNGNWQAVQNKMNGVGSYNSTYNNFNYPLVMDEPWYPVCFKLEEDASNRTASISRDNGLTWTQIHQHSRTDFLTATRLILAAQDGSSGSPAYAHVVSYEQT